MAVANVCVLRAPGTNCDKETAFAFESCGARAERVHLFRLLETPARLADFQVLCIPGGFSYGDDVGAGVIFGKQLQFRLAGALLEFLQADKLVLGICNGFQVLLKAGVLPDGCEGWPREPHLPAAATLTWNHNGKYTATWVNLRAPKTPNVFLRGIEQLELPIAHAEGRLVASSAAVIESWRQRGQLALQYVPHDKSDACTTYGGHFNPNGSAADIAGLGDRSGRVLGLMPHPERFLHATQHPQWTRRQLRGEGDGMKLFRNAVDYFV